MTNRFLAAQWNYYLPCLILFQGSHFLYNNFSLLRISKAYCIFLRISVSSRFMVKACILLEFIGDEFCDWMKSTWTSTQFKFSSQVDLDDSGRVGTPNSFDSLTASDMRCLYLDFVLFKYRIIFFIVLFFCISHRVQVSF